MHVLQGSTFLSTAIRGLTFPDLSMTQPLCESHLSEIRALSVRQPWAWAICAGVKQVENRTWSTDVRGTIAIHAASSVQVLNQFRRTSGCSHFGGETFTTGAIIGLVDIVDVSSYGPQHETDPFAQGPFCWQLTRGRLLQTPIPIKGRLNLFKLDSKLQDQLRSAPTHTVDLRVDKTASDIVRALPQDLDPITCYEELFQESVSTGKHQEALTTCGERLIELAPDRASGYLILGACRLSEPESTDCVALLRKATELAPDHALSWYFLTDAYLKEEDYQSALKAAEEAMRWMPDNAMAYENRGRVQFFSNQYAAALADLDRAIEMQPNDAGSIAMRAECKANLGDRSGALRDIETALALLPDDPSLIDLRNQLTHTDA